MEKKMNNKKNAIIFDIDGVVLNWSDSFFEWMEGNGHTVVWNAPEQWNMTGNFPELTEKDIVSGIEEFNNSESFGHLKHYDGATLTLTKLRKAISKDVVFSAITAAGTSPSCVRRRATSIEEFPIDELWIVPLGESKEHWLRMYETPSVYVEDNAKHANMSAKIGHTTLLFDRPYNKNIEINENIIIVNDWKDVEHNIKTISAKNGWLDE